jgi:hypothetical protein
MNTFSWYPNKGCNQMYKGVLLVFENEFGIAADQEAYCMDANGKERKTTGVNVEYYGKIKLRQASAQI